MSITSFAASNLQSKPKPILSTRASAILKLEVSVPAILFEIESATNLISELSNVFSPFSINFSNCAASSSGL